MIDQKHHATMRNNLKTEFNWEKEREHCDREKFKNENA